MWPKEVIPDPDRLFMRVHDNYLRDGALIPGVFREKGEGDLRGMSTDWEKYSSKEDSLARARVPESNSVISLVSGELRNLGLTVDHAPEETNRAHTNVNGIDVEKRLKLFDKKMFTWELKSKNVL